MPEELDRDKSKPKDVRYVLTLFQSKKITREFDDAINLLIDELAKKGFVDKEKILQDKNKNIVDFLDGVSFSLFFPQLMSEAEGRALNSVKKEVQLMIKKKWRFKSINLVGHYEYQLTEEEKQLPINIQKILFEVNQQVHWIQVSKPTESGDVDLSKKIEDDTIMKVFNESVGKDMRWEVFVNLTYTFFELNESFYSKVKILSDFLMKKKLLNTSLDLSDIKRRYEGALMQQIQSWEHNMQRDLAQKTDKSPQEIREFVIDFIINKMPKNYFFIVSLKKMMPEKFTDIQKELFDNININDTKPENKILITNADLCETGYACYILSRQDLL